MASKSTTAAATLLAAFLMLAAASSAMAQAPAPASEPCPDGLVQAIRLEPYDYEELIGGLTRLSTLVAAQCVCDALRSSGVTGETTEGVTSEVEAILNEFGVLPDEDELPEGFTCSPPGTSA